MLDRKIRTEVAGRRNVLLSACEFGRFVHFERSCLNDYGAVYTDTNAKSKAKEPLPRPAPHEFTPWAMKTIHGNRHLFKIITPIKVDVLARLAEPHPNQPFVASVLRGLREGFWPWADTKPDTYPRTFDVSLPLGGEREEEFVREQRDEESFGTELLPGMYSTPVHAVPKPQSEKLRLVVNQSYGEFSPNSMIPREASAGARLDQLPGLGNTLLELHRRHGPNTDIVVWKSDVSQAYRRLPVHPLWQLKQIVTVDGKRYVDRCNNFGNRGAAHIWTVFMALVVYMDDNFGASLAEKVEYYAPYGDILPADQAATLNLWDELGIPHDYPKQVSGRKLTVIGFEVDTIAMTFTMVDSKHIKLLAGVEEFIRVPPGGRRHSLREFQHLAGWMNWALNVYPLLAPALSNIYDKMREKSLLTAGVIHDLTWFSDHLRRSDGIRLLESLDWDPLDADLTIYGDASLSGLGFFVDESKSAFQAHPPGNAPSGNIFFLEALCVCWALHEIERLIKEWDEASRIRRVVIWTDSQNTYDVFNLFRAKPLYNEILKSSIDVLLRTGLKLRVLHVEGKKKCCR
ncbi:hypothetical protein C8F01DRAFT_1208405 [Mycena amicta]|nr:hypothetical protein C8F01DRAFT_1208405 [Mycena amicta]